MSVLNKTILCTNIWRNNAIFPYLPLIDVAESITHKHPEDRTVPHFGWGMRTAIFCKDVKDRDQSKVFNLRAVNVFFSLILLWL